MKEAFKYITCLLVGIIIGGSAMLFMSKRASSTFVDLIKVVYELEEETSAKEALGNGQYFLAAHHFQNLVESTSNSSKSIFQADQEFWDFKFPFSAIVLDRIHNPSDPDDAGVQRVHGLYRGMLAFAFEKNGMQEQAEQEWLQASALLDIANVSETKQLIRRSLEN
jgi:hypothetical protein